MLHRQYVWRPLVAVDRSLRASNPSSSTHRAFTSDVSSAHSVDNVGEVAVDTPRGVVRTVNTKPYLSVAGSSVSIRARNGEWHNVKFLPPPRVDPAPVSRALSSLCSWPTDLEQNSMLPTFGKPHWTLTSTKDGIYRPLAIQSSEVGDQIVARINKVADDMNHHPSIISMGQAASTFPWHMCIITTTHRPRGLGMRDIRLATAIDAILQEYNVQIPLNPKEPLRVVAIKMLEKQQLELNRLVDTAVKEAVERAKAGAATSKNYPEGTASS